MTVPLFISVNRIQVKMENKENHSHSKQKVNRHRPFGPVLQTLNHGSLPAEQDCPTELPKLAERVENEHSIESTSQPIEKVKHWKERRKALRRVANLSQEQRDKNNRARRIANLTPEQRAKINDRRLIANITPEQREKNNQRRRVASMTPQLQENINARRRVPNMTPTSIETRRKRRRIDFVSEARQRLPYHSRHPARNPSIVPEVHYLGKKNSQCTDCKSFLFKQQKNSRGVFTSCCMGGKISLPDLKPFHPYLEALLTTNDQTSKHFRNNIRKYNSAFAFASFGYQPVKLTSGPPTVIVHGQVYHTTAASIQPDNAPKYAQLYFLDPDFAYEARMNNKHNEGCRLDLMEKISTIIHQVNPFASAYTMMRDFMESSENQGRTVQIWITKDRKHDPRRYNLPIVNEVAVVFVSEDGEPPTTRDIAIHPKNDNQLQRISQISANCDPMTYPLLFPYGDAGWKPGIPKRGTSARATNGQVVEAEGQGEDEDGDEANSRNVSILQFYSYRLQERPVLNPLLHSGKLTQQFVIDSFLKVEGQRLHWNRQNQKKLRVDQYLGLMDYVHNKAERNDLRPGRIVILPSTFIGSKRSLQQNYQDAMVLVAKFGKPDLFVTFTCNPNWKEIQSELKPFETALDRPDLVADVFHLKLKEFMNDMARPNHGVLGNVKAYISTIEFQKRGLPHCHMLFILENDDKPVDPADVDLMVCAEIPDGNEDPVLYETIRTCMIHGPCGSLNPNAPCMIEEKGHKTCSKGFPKSFALTTDMNVDGYPFYRRRNDSRNVVKSDVKLDNRNVVPYNPYLSRKYNAHINVEVCSSVKSVKYIFKYIHKGHDAAIVKINEGMEQNTYNWDEIQTYLDTRYISSPEAMWRLRRYEMSTRSHAVERLPVHLPSQQTVIFEEGDEERTLRLAEQRGTKLTQWFKLNSIDADARQYFYHEIPYHYVWQKNQWKKRQRGGGKILPRMYSVSPKDVERFSLRLLLLTTKDARSFVDLRTVNGVIYPSFRDAAKEKGLLEDDGEWLKVMDEAVVFRMPSELRMLFASILTFGAPISAETMYMKYREAMCEDFLQSNNQDVAEQLALRSIQDHLLQFGKDCASFGLPTPTDNIAADANLDCAAEGEEANEMVKMMNSEQRTAYETIMDAIFSPTSAKCFFLSGAGGCGKTFVYKALTASVLSQGGVVKSVAPTGLAATLLKGGKTVHSGFGLPIDLKRESVSRFKQGTKEWRELTLTKLIIWDEISMCHVHMLEAVDRSLRDLLNKPDSPFGGIPIVVGGDFRQQPPVVPRGTRVKIVEACVKSSSLWNLFRELKLIQNMRVLSDEAEFSSWLLNIGSGVNASGSNEDYVNIPASVLTDDIVMSVFGEDINKLTPNELASRAILCPKNSDTMRVNDNILSHLTGEGKTYLSIDTVMECDNEEERANYPTEFLNSLTPMGMPPHRLCLKKGCCVMLLRNLNPRQGLCNGTRLIVESLGAKLIECSIFSGHQAGNRVLIPRIPLDVKHDLPFSLQRRQFPIRLAYSMTITKSQGQTFDKIGLYLPTTVFTHGQLYTALSRVRSKNGLSLQLCSTGSQGQIFENDDETYTFNCVFREIL